MGFIEDLRKEKAAEEQAQLIARQNVERERLASLERAKDQQLQKEKETERGKNLLEKSKAKFHQAGIPQLIQSLDEIKPVRFEEGYSDDEKYPADHRERYNFGHQDWRYHCRVYLTKHDYKPLGSLEEHVEHVFFEIITDSEGTISFKGAREKTIKTIKQSKWEKAPEILEEALGEAYRNPVVIKYTFSYEAGIEGAGSHS